MISEIKQVSNKSSTSTTTASFRSVTQHRKSDSSHCLKRHKRPIIRSEMQISFHKTLFLRTRTTSIAEEILLYVYLFIIIFTFFLNTK